MKKIILLLLCAAVLPCRADSPLTSTSWWEQYESHAIIREAVENGFSERVMAFLCNPAEPVELRLAVVNCLGWSIVGYDRYTPCIEYYKQAHKLTDEELDGQMSPETACVLAYLWALDDYFHVGQAYSLAEKAHGLKPTSRAVSMVYGLIAAQVAFDTDWCAVYRHVATVAYDTTLVPDMSDYAVGRIMEYIDLYKSECGEE